MSLAFAVQAFRTVMTALSSEAVNEHGRNPSHLHHRQRLNRSRTLMMCLHKHQLTASSAKGRVFISVRSQQLSLALWRIWPSMMACASQKRAINVTYHNRVRDAITKLDIQLWWTDIQLAAAAYCCLLLPTAALVSAKSLVNSIVIARCCLLLLGRLCVFKQAYNSPSDSQCFHNHHFTCIPVAAQNT
jgi:hypothetical protein